MIRVFCLIGLLAFSADSNAETNFEGQAHFEARFKFEINLETEEVNDNAIKEQVKNWLYYVQGNLSNEYSNSIMINTADIKFQRLTGSGIKVQVDVMGGARAQDDLKLIVPKSLNYLDLLAFESKYSSCSDTVYWYYYRPFGCVETSDTKQVATANVNVSKTQNNTSGKYPEYGRIWEDAKLSITYVYGNRLEVGDSSIISHLLSALGPYVTLGSKSFSGGSFKRFQFNNNGRIVELNFFSIDRHIRGLGQSARALMQEHIIESDIIHYNGHAGLGTNVDWLMSTLTFEPGRYYIAYINACQPYAYIKDSAFKEMEATNPGDTWTKHLEVISNVRIGDFSYGKDLNDFIYELLEGSSYTDILKNGNGNMAVIGEHDNTN